MSEAPVTITGQLSVVDAQERMHQHGIRHLPVFDGGHLVGLVSQRDLATISSLENVNPKTLSVRDAMSTQPYTCGPETPVAEVVEVMRSKKLGAAVVMEGGELKGMFTVIDALGIMAELMMTAEAMDDE
jgi:acetoin utilization protein AcuB